MFRRSHIRLEDCGDNQQFIAGATCSGSRLIKLIFTQLHSDHA